MHCAINTASSPMLARVQGHCGCANITSTGSPEGFEIPLPAGHTAGTAARVPGTFSYFQKYAKPAATTASQ
ncbi:MAG TPA: hypothetical protein VG733_07285, partial [Chthoniobacteraceae bacterium]|nr:hypothetical protein [Chthoniobacteraceae bacterium]